MQNNRCFGPIHAVAKWCKRSPVEQRVRGSSPIRGIFGNIFYWIIFFVLLYKQKQQMQCM